MSRSAITPRPPPNSDPHPLFQGSSPGIWGGGPGDPQFSSNKGSPPQPRPIFGGPNAGTKPAQGPPVALRDPSEGTGTPRPPPPDSTLCIFHGKINKKI